MSKIWSYIKTHWKSLLFGMLKGARDAVKTTAPAALIGATVATLAGCGTMQTPSSKSQTSSVYAFGLPAVVITHDNKQVADNTGDDENSAKNYKAEK